MPAILFFTSKFSCHNKKLYLCACPINNIQTIQYNAKCLSKINKNWESQTENLKMIERENVDPQYLLGYRDAIGVQQRAVHRFSELWFILLLTSEYLCHVKLPNKYALDSGD